MIRYEILFVTVPEITSEEAGKLEKQLEKSVTQEKGSVISFERWGKYHLAYPIRTYEYGVYFLMRFEVDEFQKKAVLDDLKNLFGVKFGDLVMRNILVKLHPSESLEYKRPDSLEEAPSKDIDTLMKDSKSILGSRRERDMKPSSFGGERSEEPSFEMEADEDFGDVVGKKRG